MELKLLDHCGENLGLQYAGEEFSAVDRRGGSRFLLSLFSIPAKV